jgi:hypothetical protein
MTFRLSSRKFFHFFSCPAHLPAYLALNSNQKMISDISDSGMGSEDVPKNDPLFAPFFSNGGLLDSHITPDKISGGGANYATRDEVIALEDAVCDAFETTNSAVKEGLTAIHNIAHIHSQAIGALKREIEYIKLPWYKKLWLKIKGSK